MKNVFITVGYFFSIVISGTIVIAILCAILKQKIGLEKLYPLILLVFGIFLIILILSGSISEATFGTFFGVIVGAFVAAFREIIESIKK